MGEEIVSGSARKFSVGEGMVSESTRKFYVNRLARDKLSCLALFQISLLLVMLNSLRIYRHWQ